MAHRPAKSFTVQPPDLAAFRGRTLRQFLEELVRWLRWFARQSGESPARVDRYIAVTSGTITANAGVDGPLGYGNVVRLQRQDDRTLEDISAGEEIPVDNLIFASLGDGRLVVVEVIDGIDTITAIVCP